MKPLLAITGLCALLLTASVPVAAQQSVEERVATLKGSLAASQAVLKQYEWDARMGSLADGTTYADVITLNAPAKQIMVTVDNSGHRKMGN